jgi:hypothetical protein
VVTKASENDKPIQGAKSNTDPDKETIETLASYPTEEFPKAPSAIACGINISTTRESSNSLITAL